MHIHDSGDTRDDVSKRSKFATLSLKTNWSFSSHNGFASQVLSEGGGDNSAKKLGGVMQASVLKMHK